MGSIVTLSIATDHMNVLKKDPEKLVDAIQTDMLSGGRDRPSLSGVTVHPFRHYDDFSLYLVHGSLSREVNALSVERMMEQRPDLYGRRGAVQSLLADVQRAQDELARTESLLRARVGELAAAEREDT